MGRDDRHLTMLSGWFGIMRNDLSVPDQVRHRLVLECFPHCGLTARMTNRRFSVRHQCNSEKLGNSCPSESSTQSLETEGHIAEPYLSIRLSSVSPTSSTEKFFGIKTF